MRISYTKNISTGKPQILEESNYYPFGLKHRGYNSRNDQREYKFKYNGRELQDEMDINVYDYGARNYDPAIGRWSILDPMAEKFYESSLYCYALNNPITFIDPNGMEAAKFDDPPPNADDKILDSGNWTDAMGSWNWIPGDNGGGYWQGVNGTNYDVDYGGNQINYNDLEPIEVVEQEKSIFDNIINWLSSNSDTFYNIFSFDGGSNEHYGYGENSFFRPGQDKIVDIDFDNFLKPNLGGPSNLFGEKFRNLADGFNNAMDAFNLSAKKSRDYKSMDTTINAVHYKYDIRGNAIDSFHSKYMVNKNLFNQYNVFRNNPSYWSNGLIINGMPDSTKIKIK